MSRSSASGLRRSRSATKDSSVRRDTMDNTEGAARTRSVARVVGVSRAGVLSDIFIISLSISVVVVDIIKKYREMDRMGGRC